MILVTGATGTIGRPLTDLLVSEGVEVRAVTRDARKADLPDRAEVVVADPARPETLAPALDGVTGLFLHPRAVGLAAAGLLTLARERGVRRVVVLSAINVRTTSTSSRPGSTGTGTRRSRRPPWRAAWTG